MLFLFGLQQSLQFGISKANTEQPKQVQSSNSRTVNKDRVSMDCPGFQNLVKDRTAVPRAPRGRKQNRIANPFNLCGQEFSSI